MSKKEDARIILQSVGMPIAQQSDMCCYALLALVGISESTPWANSRNEWIRIHDIIIFIRENYGVAYAENSRETIRKQAMHHFRNAALIEDNGKATNSPNYRYRLTNQAVALFSAFGKKDWNTQLSAFVQEHESLISLYESKRKMTKLPIQINGAMYELTSGGHNALQKAILEEFAPRFAPQCRCLYIGDSAERDLFKDDETLKKLGFGVSVHDKMPDVILYVAEKDWLFFIEAVTSVGPMSPKRILELEEMTEQVSSGKIYVTAFPDFKIFKKFSEELAWETEIWISDFPDHMIHLNGDRFLGPHK